MHVCCQLPHRHPRGDAGLEHGRHCEGSRGGGEGRTCRGGQVSVARAQFPTNLPVHSSCCAAAAQNASRPPTHLMPPCPPQWCLPWTLHSSPSHAAPPPPAPHPRAAPRPAVQSGAAAVKLQGTPGAGRHAWRIASGAGGAPGGWPVVTSLACPPSATALGCGMPAAVGFMPHRPHLDGAAHHAGDVATHRHPLRLGCCHHVVKLVQALLHAGGAVAARSAVMSSRRLRIVPASAAS